MCFPHQWAAPSWHPPQKNKGGCFSHRWAAPPTSKKAKGYAVLPYAYRMHRMLSSITGQPNPPPLPTKKNCWGMCFPSVDSPTRPQKTKRGAFPTPRSPTHPKKKTRSPSLGSPTHPQKTKGGCNGCFFPHHRAAPFTSKKQALNV